MAQQLIESNRFSDDPGATTHQRIVMEKKSNKGDMQAPVP